MAAYDPPRDWSETEIVLQEYQPPEDWSETTVVLSQQQEQISRQNSEGIGGSASFDADNPSSRQVTDAVSEQVDAAASVSSSISQVNASAVSDSVDSDGSVAKVVNTTVSKAVSKPVRFDGSVAEVLNVEVSEAVTGVSTTEVGVASATVDDVEEPEPSLGGAVSRGPTVIDKTENVDLAAPKLVEENLVVDLLVGKLFEERYSFKFGCPVKKKCPNQIINLSCVKVVGDLQRSLDVVGGKTFCKKVRVDTSCKTDNKKLIKRLKAL